MKKSLLKKLFFFPILLGLCCLIAQCGFKFRSYQDLPEQLRLLYLSSDEPYDKFTLLLKQHLIQLGILLTESPESAPVTLKIANAKLIYAEPDITTSDKARIYLITYRVQFILQNIQGKALVPIQNITV